MTFRNVITQALRDLGVIRSGQTPPADLIQDGLTEIQYMLDQWAADGMMLFAEKFLTVPLSNPPTPPALNVGQKIYDIGTLGTPFYPTSQFLAIARPVRIVRANLIINTSTPVVRRPIDVIDGAEWMRIRVQDVSGLPSKLYYDGGGYSLLNGASNGLLYFWPVPNYAYQVELFVPFPIVQPGIDTDVNYPYGYSDAIRLNLALRMLPMMSAYIKIDKPQLALIEQRARETMETLRSVNAKAPLLRSGPEFRQTHNASWNYMIGEPTTGNQF